MQTVCAAGFQREEHNVTGFSCQHRLVYKIDYHREENNTDGHIMKTKILMSVIHFLIQTVNICSLFQLA